MVTSIKVLKTGYSFLLSRNETMLAHPDKKMVMKEYIRELSETTASLSLTGSC